jgi:TolA-binding protein
MTGIVRSIRGLRHNSVAITLILASATSTLARMPGPAEVRSTPTASGVVDAARGLDAANGLLNRGLFDLAETEYRGVLAGTSDAAQEQSARYGLGVCLYRLNRHADAATELQKVVACDGFAYTAEALVLYGRCLLVLNRPADAAEAFARVLREYGAHELAATAAAGRVEALYRSGDIAGCASAAAEAGGRVEGQLRCRVQYFQALAAVAGSNHSAAADVLTVLIAGEPDAALLGQARMLLGECRAALGAPEEALELFTAVIADGPAELQPAARMASADTLYRLARYAEAEAHLQSVLTAEVDPRLRAEALRLRAHLRLAAEQHSAALDDFEAARALDAAGDDLYWIAKCQLRLGEPVKAAALFAEYVRANPESPFAAEALYDLAVAQVESSQFAAAGATLGQFRERFAQHTLAPAALHLAAAAAYRDGDDAACEAFCRDFLQRYPEHELAGDTLLLAIDGGQRAQRWTDVIAAGAAFAERFATDSRAADARYHAGLAACRLERFAEAEQFFSELLFAGELPQRFAPAALALGDVFFQRQEWERAEQWLSRFLTGGNEIASADDALLKRGIARARLQRYDGAVQDFDALLRRWPDSLHVSRAQLERGQALLQLGQTESASAAFARAGAETSNTELAALASNQQALLAMQAADHAQAAAHFSRVIETTTNDDLRGEALFQRGQCLLASGDARAADADFAALLERQPAHARSAAARAWRIVALARQNQPQAALDAYAQVQPADLLALDGATRAALLHERAWALRETDRAADASRAYAEVLALSDAPPDLRAHAALAAAEIDISVQGCAAGRGALAELISTSGVESTVPAPVRERALYRLGLCAIAAQQWQDAAQLLEGLLSEYAGSEYAASALIQCGQANLRLGHHERALERLERAVREYGADAAVEIAPLSIGECLAGLQRWPQSERAFADFLDRHPEHPRRFEAWFGVGWAREHQNRYAEAISAYRAVVDNHQGPTAARAQFQIGECLFAQNEYDAAARELLKVDILYDYPEWNAAALFEAGRCFERLGRAADAGTQYAAVVERFGDSEWARAAAQKLPPVDRTAVAGN